MEKDELIFLKEAYEYLENPSFVTKMTDYLGKPIQLAMDKLPKEIQCKIGEVSEKALKKSLEMAHHTLLNSEKPSGFTQVTKESGLSRLGHNIATATTGALGGFFGEAGVLIELPITTTLIMRSILAQGQTYGDIPKEELIANALFIFSLGSNKSEGDDEMDSAYYTSRIAMDLSIAQAAEFLATNGPKTILKNIEAGTAPLVLELITKVAQRFNVTVTEKMLVEALPVVGAGTGAAINLLFTDFFTLSAKYHFGIKHLELKYGEDVVQKTYNQLPKVTSQAS